jgi:hypothetical protein
MVTQIQTKSHRPDISYVADNYRVSLATQGAQFKYVRMVTLQGRVFAFAMHVPESGAASIGYCVLMAQSNNVAADVIWRDFATLTFPKELRPVGRRLVTVDIGISSAAVPDAPFQVCADDSYIYVFRQSANSSLYVDRFYFDEATIRLKNVPEVRFRRSRNPDIPLDRKDTFGLQDMNKEAFIEPTLDLCFLDKI